MRKWDLKVNCTEIFLHENILDILFKYKNEISSKMSDVRGLYNLDHIAINILDSNNKLLVFSSTPSVEYNLLATGLWKYDNSFHPLMYPVNSMFWWDQLYSADHANTLKSIKEEKHGFTLGLCISRKIQDLNIVYSFATRHKDPRMKKNYMDHKNDLLKIGDYSFKSIYNILSKYRHHQSLSFQDEYKSKHKDYIKLIIDNT